jgi:hypothetical protein
MKDIIQHMKQLFEQADASFTQLYDYMKMNGQALPMRFQMPDTNTLISFMKMYDAHTFMLKYITFVKHSIRYLTLHDEAVNISMKHDIYVELQCNMVKFADDMLLGHALNMLSSINQQKEWLHEVLKNEHEMIINMMYLPKTRIPQHIYTRANHFYLLNSKLRS